MSEGNEAGALRLVYMTAGTREEALKLARSLVERRLVACVNVIDKVTSVFYWEGEAREDSEVVVIAKTTAERMADVTQTVRSLHSYDVPCCVALPLAAGEGNPAFLDWIAQETKARS